MGQRAAIDGDIALEERKTKLLQIKAENDKVGAQSAGEAEGVKLAASVTKFVQELNASIPNSSMAIDLLRFYEEQRTATTQTKDLASGSAQLFLTPQDLNLKMVTGGPGHDRNEL